MEREKKTKRSADPPDVVQSPAVQVGGSSSSGTANRAPQDEHMDVDDNSKKRRTEERLQGEGMVSAVTLAPMCKSLLVHNSSILDLTEKRHDGEKWDFNIREHRYEAASKIKKDQPALVIGGSDRRGSSGEQEKYERYFVHEQKNGSGEGTKRSFQRLQNLDTVTITIDSRKYKVAKKEFIQIVTTSTMIASKINQGNVLVRDGTRR
jgi:hypothetical protein